MTVGRWTESLAGMRRSAAVGEATRKNYERFLTTFGMTVGRWTESLAWMRRSTAVGEATRKNYEGFLTTFGMTVGEECGGKSPSLQYEGHGDQDAEGKDRMRIPQQVRSDDRTLLK